MKYNFPFRFHSQSVGSKLESSRQPQKKTNIIEITSSTEIENVLSSRRRLGQWCVLSSLALVPFPFNYWSNISIFGNKFFGCLHRFYIIAVMAVAVALILLYYGWTPSVQPHKCPFAAQQPQQQCRKIPKPSHQRIERLRKNERHGWTRGCSVSKYNFNDGLAACGV